MEVIDIEKKVMRLVELKKQMSELESEKKEIESQVKEVVKKGSKVILPNGYAVSVSKESYHTRIDSSALKEARPDIYARFTTEVYVSPRVTITPPKKEEA